MTPLEESLARILEGLPPGSAVSLPVDWLRAQMAAVQETQQDSLADLTMKKVAEEMGRSVSTVRAWVAQELIPGAYKLRGREWRVPRAGLREFMNRQTNTVREDRPGLGSKCGTDLGLWREVRRQTHA